MQALLKCSARRPQYATVRVASRQLACFSSTPNQEGVLQVVELLAQRVRKQNGSKSSARTQSPVPRTTLERYQHKDSRDPARAEKDQLSSGLSPRAYYKAKAARRSSKKPVESLEEAPMSADLAMLLGLPPPAPPPKPTPPPTRFLAEPYRKKQLRAPMQTSLLGDTSNVSETAKRVAQDMDNWRTRYTAPPKEPEADITELPDLPEWDSLGLHPSLLEVLREEGFDRPSRVQARAIPFLLHRHGPAFIESPTGSGKTFAFLLPLLTQLLQSPRNGCQLMIICPTRELALQTFGEVVRLLKLTRPDHPWIACGTDLKALLLVGGGMTLPEHCDLLESTQDFPALVIGTSTRVWACLDTMQKEQKVTQRKFWAQKQSAQDGYDAAVERETRRLPTGDVATQLAISDGDLAERLLAIRSNAQLELAKANRWLDNLSFVVIDEVDRVFNELGRYVTKKARRTRELHGESGKLAMQRLRDLHPTVRLIAASATINHRTRRGVKGLLGSHLTQLSPQYLSSERPSALPNTLSHRFAVVPGLPDYKRSGPLLMEERVEKLKLLQAIWARHLQLATTTKPKQAPSSSQTPTQGSTDDPPAPIAPALVFLPDDTKLAEAKELLEGGPHALRVELLHKRINESLEHRAAFQQAVHDGDFDIILCTSSIGRGLDIRGLSHVFLLTSDRLVTSYSHLAGRVGRLTPTGEQSGVVTSILAPWEMDASWNQLRRVLNQPFFRLDIDASGIDFSSPSSDSLDTSAQQQLPPPSDSLDVSSHTPQQLTLPPMEPPTPPSELILRPEHPPAAMAENDDPEATDYTDDDAYEVIEFADDEDNDLSEDEPTHQDDW